MALFNLAIPCLPADLSGKARFSRGVKPFRFHLAYHLFDSETSGFGPFLVEFAYFALDMHKCNCPMTIAFREAKLGPYLTHASFLQIKFLYFEFQ